MCYNLTRATAALGVFFIFALVTAQHRRTSFSSSLFFYDLTRHLTARDVFCDLSRHNTGERVFTDDDERETTFRNLTRAETVRDDLVLGARKQRKRAHPRANEFSYVSKSSKNANAFRDVGFSSATPADGVWSTDFGHPKEGRFKRNNGEG